MITRVMGLLFIIMNPTFRIILIVILISSVIFLPALMGASIIESPEEDDATDTDGDDFSFISQFSVFWTKIPVHQLSTLLRLGISIFTLFIVYLGGRSKHRRFNDRTIDHVIALKAELLKTALDRAVFNFLFFIPSNSTEAYFVCLFIQAPISHLRRY